MRSLMQRKDYIAVTSRRGKSFSVEKHDEEFRKQEESCCVFPPLASSFIDGKEKVRDLNENVCS